MCFRDRFDILLVSSAKLRFDMFLKKERYSFSFLRVKSCLDKTLYDYIRKSEK